MIIFNPNGPFDVNSDPSDLPESSDGKNIQSGAVVRCKNLHMERNGVAKTRAGSAKVNTTAIDTDINLIIEDAGSRYAFSGDQIYQNESSLVTGLTEAQWSAIVYNQYNDTNKMVYGLNGTDRKRITILGTVREWGIEPPSAAPTIDIEFDCITGGAWTASGSGTNEYYLVDASSTELDAVESTHSITIGSGNVNAYENGSLMTEGTVGSLSAGEYATGDNDSLGYTTLYVRLSDGADPDSKAASYVKLVFGDGNLEASKVYDVKYTYAMKTGGVVVSESNPSPKFTVSLGQLNYNARVFITFAASSDGQVTNYIAYRTLAGVGAAIQIYYLEEDKAILYGTIQDTDATIIENALIETDHDRPPLGSIVVGPQYDGTCFIIKDNLLYYSKPKQPEYWPTTYYIEVCQPGETLQNGVFYNGQLHIISDRQIYYIQGTGHLTFFPIPMKAKTGSKSPFGVFATKKGIYHVGIDGIYLYSGNDVKISKAFEPIFLGEAVEGLPAISDITNCWLFYENDKLYFGYTSTGYTYPTNVIVMSENGKIYYYDYGLEIITIAKDETNDRILVADDTGFIREIEKVAATDDSGTAISWDIKSKDFILPTRPHFPRYVKYDIDASSATGVTGTYNLAGSAHQTHTITGTRDTTRRLVATGNGERASLQVTGSGVVSIYTIEAE